jgi:hypothetical protein
MNDFATCGANYAIQCRDITSGETGCFLFDTPHWQQTGEFRAVSPVFRDLTAFCAWDNSNPVRLRRDGLSIGRTVTRQGGNRNAL